MGATDPLVPCPELELGGRRLCLDGVESPEQGLGVDPVGQLCVCHFFFLISSCLKERSIARPKAIKGWIWVWVGTSFSVG
jgi:hypothetical protein